MPSAAILDYAESTSDYAEFSFIYKALLQISDICR